DGIPEGNLYPQGTGSPGNRGTVDIGDSNNSTADIARQIKQGISSDDLVKLGKPLEICSDGTMTLNGDTGISAGVKDELASLIGKTRIVPIFSQVSGNGNNATYTVVKWVGIRVLDVKLTGSLSSKKVMIQAAPMVCPYVTVGGSTDMSSGVFSPVVLTR
ncbi:MAG: Tad domain-containing protein, partial [Aureliella sp.]